MNSIASMATNALFLKYMSTFFKKNEIFSEDIKKCQNVFLCAFLVLHSYNQWRNQRFEPGWKI